MKINNRDLPTSERAAIAAGSLYYFTGRPCSKGHTEARYVRNRSCVVCRRLSVLAYKKSTPERHRKWNRRITLLQRSTPERRRKWNKKTRDPVKVSLRRRLRDALRGNAKTGSAVRDLGCTIPEFRAYIEVRFQAGMSWDNWGKWHLDHILPLASFDLTDRAQFLVACHFTNYQPLWAKDNQEKCDKIDGRRHFSLRSTDASPFHCGDAARHLGERLGRSGGGHKNAAGFDAPLGWEGE